MMENQRIRGREEMQELALAAITSLEEAKLMDEMRELRTRVLDRNPDALFETAQVGEGLWQWSFKPMVELLLRHTQWASRERSLTLEERKGHIAFALDMAGF